MKHEVYYKGVGGEINFSKLPFLYQEFDFFDYEHEYDSYVLPDLSGTSINIFSKEGMLKKLVVGIASSDYRKSIFELEKVLEADIAKKEWGRLFVNNSYIDCYIVKSRKTYFNKFKRVNIVELDIITKKSKWINEDVYEFLSQNEEGRVSGFSFPLSFPTHFSDIKPEKKFFNDSISQTNFLLTIYGECVHPELEIGENIYSVEVELLKSERLEIDSFNKTIIKITEIGERINMFNYRNKYHNIFKKIEAGQNKINLNGNFGIKLQLFHERSVPNWI